MSSPLLGAVWHCRSDTFASALSKDAAQRASRRPVPTSARPAHSRLVHRYAMDTPPLGTPLHSRFAIHSSSAIFTRKVHHPFNGAHSRGRRLGCDLQAWVSPRRGRFGGRVEPLSQHGGRAGNGQAAQRYVFARTLCALCSLGVQLPLESRVAQFAEDPSRKVTGVGWPPRGVGRELRFLSFDCPSSCEQQMTGMMRELGKRLRVATNWPHASRARPTRSVATRSITEGH